MSQDESSKEKSDVPVLSISGVISHIQECEYYRCSMCDQVYRKEIENPIAHSMMCTGY